ncbi:hypothetical protein, partial [Nocardia farcinica]|uniref:hypothetical protein n=1 Tax=Nocardia farcinica TaxID=37329 RepID=UPI00245440B2
AVESGRQARARVRGAPAGPRERSTEPGARTPGPRQPPPPTRPPPPPPPRRPGAPPPPPPTT